jgi:pimeloyl-ACP methyl ester carboxylesterase
MCELSGRSSIEPVPSEMNFRYVIGGNGTRLRVAVAGSGPLVLMVHGFPESWFSWRHQMPAIAAAGFTAAALDVRGYGGSDKPDAIEAYAITELAADIAAVIDAMIQPVPS